MKKVKTAIVGCGAVAEIFHIPTLQRMPETEIAALIDVNVDRAKQLKKEYNLNCETYNNYQDILSKDIEAIFILTPPKLHAKIALEVMAAGKHVFCEKPMEANLENAKKMVDFAKDKGVKLMVGLNFRFIPQYRKIHDLIESGFLGKLIGASSTFFTNAFMWPSKTKFQYTKEGGGALFEMGCHHLDLMRWYLGDVKNVLANIRTIGDGVTIDDTAAVFIEFENGATGHLATGWGDLSVNEMRVYGEGGYLVASGSKNEILFTAKGFVGQSPLRIVVDKNISPYHEEFRHFFDCIRRDKDPLTNGLEGYKTLEAILAAYESNERKVPVPVVRS